jgi:biotin synthase
MAHSLSAVRSPSTALRHDWRKDEIAALFALPFNDLLFRAAAVHREHFDPNAVQVSTLLSIKTGACPEDCKYCPQASRYHTGLERERLLEVEKVINEAKRARDKGASRFCMGAAWRNPHERDMPYVIEMIKQVKALGLETCMTLGMLTESQAQDLADAGLDYYNHNLDTSRDYYSEIITTRTYDDRLHTLEHVRAAGLKVCSGGIVGMGESRADRVGLLWQLANLPAHPESVPVNMLVKIKGTPLAEAPDLDNFEFVRTIAVARILMPTSFVRLSAGRQEMNDEMQALCFMAGANSIFYGERLLTTDNPEASHDMQLFERLGIHPLDPREEASDETHEQALVSQVVATQSAQQGLYYDAMQSRTAKQVLPAADHGTSI